MPKTKLTARFVETIKSDIRIEYQDATVNGLALRISPTGSKSWTIRYNRESDGRKQRVTLGRFPALSLDKARVAALKVLTSVAEGNDPAGIRRQNREIITFSELGDLFIQKYAKVNKKTWGEDKRILEKEFYPTLGRMKAKAVRKRDILEVTNKLAEAGKLAQSRNILACVRRMCSWAVEEDYLDVSPCNGIKAKGKPSRRERVLSNDEIRKIWNALPDARLADVTKDVIRMLFLTGQRSGEVCEILASEIDLEKSTWYLPSTKTKNERPHVVPLNSMAMEILTKSIEAIDDKSSDTPLFSTIGAPMASNAISQAVRKRLQILDNQWQPHDIRRTVSTGMAEIGIFPHIIEACLNHISGFRSGVAGVYNRAHYDNEKREALEKWSDHLEGIVA